jgi:hypothetical protein
VPGVRRRQKSVKGVSHGRKQCFAPMICVMFEFEKT